MNKLMFSNETVFLQLHSLVECVLKFFHIKVKTFLHMADFEHTVQQTYIHLGNIYHFPYSRHWGK